jgi:hypothetical protein
MPIQSGTFAKRAERVLIEIAESRDSTVKQRLDAVRQLSAIKRDKPKRKSYPKKISAVPSSNTLGSR